MPTLHLLKGGSELLDRATSDCNAVLCADLGDLVVWDIVDVYVRHGSMVKLIRGEQKTEDSEEREVSSDVRVELGQVS